MKTPFLRFLRLAALLLVLVLPVSGNVTVNTAADESNGSLDPGLGTGTSLREAVTHAPAGSVIDFAPSLNLQTLVLSAGTIVFGKDLTLDASALPSGITVSGNDLVRVFQVPSTRVVTMIRLKVVNGSHSGDGGGILNAGTLGLRDCEFSGNHAGDGGGAIENSGTITLTACTVAGNAAEIGGGAIEHAAGTLTATHCTFAENTAAFGGAIDGDGSSTIRLYSCTLSGNHAEDDGGGIEETTGTLLLENSIVAGNSAGDQGPDLKASSINTQSGMNLISSTAGLGGSFSGIVAAPGLAALAGYGGVTRTMLPLPGSPVLDAAGATASGIDQRGMPRLAGAAVDIGAVEDQGGELTIGATAVLEQRDLGQAAITTSPYDIGHPDHVFDDSTFSLLRSAAVNPAFVQVAFTGARTTTAFHTLFSSGGAYQWKVEKADTQADMDSRSGSWAEIVPWQASAGDDVGRHYGLPSPVTARIYKLVVQRLTGDNYVHINDWQLDGPVWTVSEGIEVRLDVPDLQSHGQAVLTASPYDTGSPPLVFDGLAGTLLRSAAVNPAYVQVAFTTARPVTAFRTLFSSGGAYQWKVEKADTQADMDSRSGSWAEIVPWQASAGDDVFRGQVLPAGTSAKIYRLVVQRLTGDNYVHINEWELLGPARIRSVAVQPAVLELLHPSSWEYECFGTDFAEVTHDLTAKVFWSSSRPATATVGAGGTTNTVAPGTTAIRATAGMLAAEGFLTVVPSTPPPGDFAATAFHTTAHLTWDAVPGDVAGYKIFRRTAGGSYPATPAVRTGPRLDHTDYGLVPGETYFWKIAAFGAGDELLSGFSAEISATLQASGAGLRRIAAPKLLIALYHGEMTADEKNAAVAGMQLALDWYYRNSGQRFLLDVTWMPVAAAVPMPDKLDDFSYVGIEADLRSRGVADGQYDLIFTTGAGIDHCYGGFLIFNGTTWGAKAVACGAAYPGKDPGTNYTIPWSLTHEVHHSIDAMVNQAGGEDMLYNHFPWNYPSPLDGEHVDWGLHFDGISKIMHRYDDYAGWSAAGHGDCIEVIDSDGDGLADADSRVPVDEARFGSLPGTADSDGDGLGDGREYDLQVYTSLDPLDPDSDGDGLPDGSDPQPLYAIPAVIPFTAAPPVLDGAVEARWSKLRDGYFFTRQPGDFGLESYANYDGDYLYLAFRSTRPGMYYRLALDGSGHLGRYESDVRHPDADPGDRSTWYADVYAEGNHIEIRPDSPVASVYDVGPIPGSLVVTGASGGWYTTEVRLPKVLPRGCGFTYFAPDAPTVAGLQMVPGRIFGITLTLSESPGDEFAGEWTGLFETHTFVDFALSGTGDLDGDGLDAAAEGVAQTDPLDPDSEDDGMPDGWEASHGLDPLSDDAGDDADGDGFVNLDEFGCGTDPRNPASRLRVLSIGTGTGAGFTVTWSTVHGRSYLVETSGTLHGSWTEVPASAVTELDGEPGTEGNESWTDAAAPAGRNFYRVKCLGAP